MFYLSAAILILLRAKERPTGTVGATVHAGAVFFLAYLSRVTSLCVFSAFVVLL